MTETRFKRNKKYVEKHAPGILNDLNSTYSASECLSINIAKKIVEIDKGERNIVKCVTRPKFMNGIWKLRSKK